MFVNLYLHVHSLFHRIPAYSDSDTNSTHIQGHSQHRSCKDRFYMETEVKKKDEKIIKKLYI